MGPNATGRPPQSAGQASTSLVPARSVNLREKLDAFREQWTPRVVARFNGHDIMVVKAEGEFVWHSHPDTDDFFLVVDGELDVDFRDRTITVRPGELYVVPRGVEHRTAARRGEVSMMLIEVDGTPNTGDQRTAAVKIDI